jgi:prepilin-type processing-associated H-X9-DG protein
MCPVRKTDCTFSCNPKDYNDFPSRKLVTYSFRIGCPKGAAETGRQVIVADMSPVFETLPSPSEPINISDELLKRNSANHSGRGQNVLFCDGSVQFVKSRKVGPSLDDIFTIQNTIAYQGTEMPSSEADAFLAP